MGNSFWMKLYYEVLDDPKMGRLSDRQFWRAIRLSRSVIAMGL